MLEYVLYLALGTGYISLNICKNSLNYTLKICILYWIIVIIIILLKVTVF